MTFAIRRWPSVALDRMDGFVSQASSLLAVVGTTVYPTGLAAAAVGEKPLISGRRSGRACSSSGGPVRLLRTSPSRFKNIARCTSIVGFQSLIF